jgi:hypothetical protein
MFEDKTYNKLFNKAGLTGSSPKHDILRVFGGLAICWVPIALLTLFKGNFWTGEITTSFITDFDFQARFIIAMPIFILADRGINMKLSLIIDQFTNSGIVGKEIQETFNEIIQSKVRFLKSRWTGIAIIILCYAQTFAVYYYESSNTSVLTWQVQYLNGEPSFNFAGYWSIFISVPFVLFLVYRWFLRLIFWWVILFKISKLEITLFPFHPDLSGGLGFLGYSIRYFSPIAFAFSTIVAGNAADFMLIEGIQLIDIRLPLIGYLIFIIIFFTLPMLFFTVKMQEESEKCIYENYDYTNGIFRELRKQIAKGFDEVTPKDLKLPDFSAAADLSALVDNALKMKFMPFKIKDLVPLVIMAVIPFFGIVLIDIPLKELLAAVLTLLR